MATEQEKRNANVVLKDIDLILNQRKFTLGELRRKEIVKQVCMSVLVCFYDVCCMMCVCMYMYVCVFMMCTIYCV